MRPLVFDFPNDTEALKQQTEFMFGPSLLVCPVTEPGIKTMRVYLPDHEQEWVSFNALLLASEKGIKIKPYVYKGGTYVDVEVSMDRIPVFIKADNIINLE